MAELETREFEVRFNAETTGGFTALAVPYDQAADIGGAYFERFAPGAIDTVENVPIFYGHDYSRLPIGLATAGEDRADGYAFTAEFTQGIQFADEVRAAVEHGTLNKVSIGFRPIEQTRDGNTITRTKVEIREISIVPFPAYSGAEIKEVREETPDVQTDNKTESEVMENTISELDVRAAIDDLAELRREVEAGKTVEVAKPSYSEIRSMGEYVKAFAKRDAAAIELYRAATTTADTVALPGWLGFINNLIESNRPTHGAFSRAALPAAGMTVEYAKVSSNTIAIDQQSPEGEALAFGNIAIDTVSADVKTYGGYTSFTRQVVERSTVNFVDTAFRALAIAYAKKTNANVVAALAALDFTGKTFDADGGTAASLLEGIANGSASIAAATGLSPEFILAAPDAYVTMMKIAGGDGRPVVNVSGAGVNNIGTANVPALSGNLFGLPVIVDAALATGVVYLANSQALQTLESAGSPVRLQDSDVTTLVDNLSVYGYQAITVPFEGAIVKLDVTA